MLAVLRLTCAHAVGRQRHLTQAILNESFKPGLLVQFGAIAARTTVHKTYVPESAMFLLEHGQMETFSQVSGESIHFCLIFTMCLAKAYMHILLVIHLVGSTLHG